MRLQPGDPIGGYEVLHFVGISNDGATRYLAARGVDRVEVKRYEMLEDGAFVRLRFDEAKLNLGLAHPRIQRILEIGRDRDHYFCVLEHVNGAELGHVVRAARDRGVPVSFDVAVAAGIAVADALHYLHDARSANGTPLDIVHTDVTAWTVLVAADGSVKLELGGLMRVAAGGVGGKKLWFSPEQVRGRPLDRRSDLFQLGILLYEVTTGRFPFPGDTELDVYQQIIGVNVQPPGRRTPGYPAALERVVLRALAREPAERHATARELHDDLVRVAGELRLDTSVAVLARLVREAGVTAG